VAVKIRLMRVGKKKQPTYRVVVADSRSPRDGRYIETIGHYGPRQEPSLVEIDDEKALGWLRQGAQLTERVHKLLVSSGVWDRFQAEQPKAAARVKVPAKKPAKPAAPATPTPPAAAEPAAGEPAEAAASSEAAAPPEAAAQPEAAEAAASSEAAAPPEAAAPDTPPEADASEESSS
jgi:small subunit ribosomal protein S16